jgi:5-methylcytosine-specific restriction protein B
MPNRQEQLTAMLRELRLSTMATNYAPVALKASKEHLTHEGFLYELARLECEEREQRRIERHLIQSKLPREKTFRTFQWERLSATLRLQIERLRNGAFVTQAHNVIAVGAPGVGKTYWAERTACELAARARFNKPFEDLNSEEKTAIRGSSHSPCGNVRLCCFHPSYGYEDFLEGLRPTIQNGVMHFAPRDGIFKQLCQDARQAPQENFYLIIDEINRGDLPRIFGELLTILEKDKRDRSILLPLTNQPFRMPPNVYLIGTMNTADRSIALLDAALRRRFGFIELMPDSTHLGNTLVGGIDGIPLGPWLDELNQRITTFVGQDARNLQIGHAYFLEKGQPVTDFSTFVHILQDDIVPLLEEYCYADYHKLEQILGKDLVDAKTQQIRYELFGPAQQANLIRALLAMNPDIMASRRAALAEKEAIEAEAEMEEQEEQVDEDEDQ